jgi:hypothetical protein
MILMYFFSLDSLLHVHVWQTVKKDVVLGYDAV